MEGTVSRWKPEIKESAELRRREFESGKRDAAPVAIRGDGTREERVAFAV